MITIAQLYNQKKEFLNFKVVYHCVKCKKKIETFWHGYAIKGNFTARDVLWSEVLDCVVNDPQGIICYNCQENKPLYLTLTKEKL